MFKVVIQSLQKHMEQRNNPNLERHSSDTLKKYILIKFIINLDSNYKYNQMQVSIERKINNSDEVTRQGNAKSIVNICEC